MLVHILRTPFFSSADHHLTSGINLWQAQCSNEENNCHQVGGREPAPGVWAVNTLPVSIIGQQEILETED